MSNDGTLSQVAGDLEALVGRAQSYKLGGYDPYPFQRQYHRSRGPSGEPANQVALFAGNQVGKSECGGADVAIHVTGLYPDWWDGPDMTRLLRENPVVWCGGQNNDRVRDIAQKALLGPPHDPSKWGTGWIPKDRIRSTVRKQGLPGAVDHVVVKHVQGFDVTLEFKSYDASLLDWAGTSVAMIWLDEEPPLPIYDQCLARMIATGGVVKLTFTPERGGTEVVQAFLTSIKPGQAVIQASWDDAAHEDGRTHLNKQVLDQLAAAIPPHQLEMRSKGVPVLGSGSVFAIPESDIACERFPIPDSYACIAGLDFGAGGASHPTACVWIAIDRDTDTAYVFDCYRSSDPNTATHGAAIRGRGLWIPVAWPHDGNRRASGGYQTRTLRDIYKGHGVNMLNSHFTNPGDGGIHVEPGIQSLTEAMSQGRFKVFKHLHDWFEEYRLYYRNEKGEVVRARDDLMSATRYAYQSRRFARTPSLDMQRSRRSLVMPGTDWNPTDEI